MKLFNKIATSNVNGDVAEMCSRCELHNNAMHMNTLNGVLDSAYSFLGVGLVFIDGNRNVTHANLQAKERLQLPESFVLTASDLIKNFFARKGQIELNEALDKLYFGNAQGALFVDVIIQNEACVVMLEILDQVVPVVMMFIFEPRRDIEVSSSVVVRNYGLTKAEARLTLALVNGMTVTEYAEANGTSIHTVYSQVKCVLAKTGVRRQAELVRLVLECSPSFKFIKRHNM